MSFIDAAWKPCVAKTSSALSRSCRRRSGAGRRLDMGPRTVSGSGAAGGEGQNGEYLDDGSTPRKPRIRHEAATRAAATAAGSATRDQPVDGEGPPASIRRRAPTLRLVGDHRAGDLARAHRLERLVDF